MTLQEIIDQIIKEPLEEAKDIWAAPIEVQTGEKKGCEFKPESPATLEDQKGSGWQFVADTAYVTEYWEMQDQVINFNDVLENLLQEINTTEFPLNK